MNSFPRHYKTTGGIEIPKFFSTATMDILLVGYYTRFSCAPIKRNSQRAKITIDTITHPLPLPHTLLLDEQIDQ